VPLWFVSVVSLNAEDGWWTCHRANCFVKTWTVRGALPATSGAKGLLVIFIFRKLRVLYPTCVLGLGHTILTSREPMWCYACSWDVRGDLTQHGTQYTPHSLKYMLPQGRISYNVVLSLINSTIL